MNFQELWKKAQKKFLSYLFLDKKYIAMSLTKVDSSLLPDYHQIYDLVVKYFNKYKGILTDERAQAYWQNKNLSNDVISKYLILMSDLRVNPEDNESEFEAIIDELKEYKVRMALWSLAHTTFDQDPLHCSTELLDQIKTEFKKKVISIANQEASVNKKGSIRDSAKNAFEYYKIIKNNPEIIKTIKTGFNTIDNKEGGFRPGELIYVIGRKGDGKSVLLLNLAHNAWEQGENVILFSLEISKDDYERRFISRAAQISSNGLKRGKLTEKEEYAFEQYVVNSDRGLTPSGKKAGVFYIVDCPAGCTPAFIDSEVDNVEQLLGIKFNVIITDYAGIMQPNVQVDQKRHEQGSIALDLKRIARTRNCVVVSAAQMTRKGKDETNSKDGRADTSHVAESDQISDHIDWGIAIRSINDLSGVVESFKTRDAEPFRFSFNKKYSCMYIVEVEDTWEDALTL